MVHIVGRTVIVQTQHRTLPMPGHEKRARGTLPEQALAECYVIAAAPISRGMSLPQGRNVDL
jgi:hypothetical protein